MCGIVGAATERLATPILIESLKRLEYRGYDSAGIAIINPESQQIGRARAQGKITALEKLLEKNPLPGNIGISHTRWATHGEPNELNAHPHASPENKFVVVHNGIIENYQALKKKLINLNYRFQSDTDTEVIPFLFHYYSQQETDIVKIIQKTIQELKGSFALALLAASEPEKLFALRSGSPLVLGLGIQENFVASDPLALLPLTQQFIYLEEGDIAVLTNKNYEIYNKEQKIKRFIQKTNFNLEATHKGQYRHYMQKEIFEQPEALLNTMNNHIIQNRIQIESFGHNAKSIFEKVKHIQIVACGTSFHASLIAKNWLEELAGIPCTVDTASEFRYRYTIIQENTLFIALSQSGETADTLAALRKAKSENYLATLCICNVAGSSLTREADITHLTYVGIEIGVAATKTFTAQLVALLLLSLSITKLHAPQKETHDIIQALNQLPNLLQATLNLDPAIQHYARLLAKKNNALFIARGLTYPIALEGALKLKEISYIHAEAYPAGELKHGPLALVDENMPVIVLAPLDHLFEKLNSNMQEIQARRGELFIFADENLKLNLHNHHVVTIPAIHKILTPILYTVPLQLLAYHVAILKGTDVDQPRNLAKSVTVE